MKSGSSLSVDIGTKRITFLIFISFLINEGVKPEDSADDYYLVLIFNF
jgi:hypothetical protein